MVMTGEEKECNLLKGKDQLSKEDVEDVEEQATLEENL